MMNEDQVGPATRSLRQVSMTLRRRGRPPRYDRKQALEGALNLFWERGYDAVTMDELARAMRMHRPSIAGAFGDKRGIYRDAMALYRQRLLAELSMAMAGGTSLRCCLQAACRCLIDRHLKGESGPRSCLAVRAVADGSLAPEMMRALCEDIALFETLLIRRAGPQLEGRAARQATRVLVDVLFGLSLRACAGASRSQLIAHSTEAIDLILERA